MIRSLMHMDIVSWLIQIVAVVFSLSFHECAHAWWAYRLGDTTAAQQGRISLNPLRHLEPLGFLMMLFAPIGWARPVPVNPAGFRRGKNARSGFMEVALAGPVSNLLLAWISCFIYVAILTFSPRSLLLPSHHPVNLLIQLFITLFAVNVNLAVFNLLPFPPLDGFNIYGRFLPASAYRFLGEKSSVFMSVLFFMIAFLPQYFGRCLQAFRAPFFWLIQKSVTTLVGFFSGGM